LTDSVVGDERMRHLNHVYLPNRDRIIEAIGLLRQLLFPGFFGRQGLTSTNVKIRIGELVLELAELLYEQVRYCLRYRENIAASTGIDDRCDECDAQAGEIVRTFLDRLTAV